MVRNPTAFSPLGEGAKCPHKKKNPTMVRGLPFKFISFNPFLANAHTYTRWDNQPRCPPLKMQSYILRRLKDVSMLPRTEP